MTSRDGFERVRAGLENAGVQLKLHQDGSYRGRCPLHQGNSADSVSVRHHVPTTGGGGRAQLRCWGGCDEREILDHIGLTLADLYDDPLPERARGAVREHPYLGAAGQLLGVVQRFEPKTFRPLTHNGAGWTQKGTAELSATPYRLTAVVAAIEQGKHPSTSSRANATPTASPAKGSPRPATPEAPASGATVTPSGSAGPT